MEKKPRVSVKMKDDIQLNLLIKNKEKLYIDQLYQNA